MTVEFATVSDEGISKFSEIISVLQVLTTLNVTFTDSQLISDAGLGKFFD